LKGVIIGRVIIAKDTLDTAQNLLIYKVQFEGKHLWAETCKIGLKNRPKYLHLCNYLLFKVFIDSRQEQSDQQDTKYTEELPEKGCINKTSEHRCRMFIQPDSVMILFCAKS